MTRQIRLVVAMALVAAVVCVERAPAVTAEARPQVVEMARQWAGRIALSLRATPQSVGRGQHEASLERAVELKIPLTTGEAPMVGARLVPAMINLPPPLA